MIPVYRRKEIVAQLIVDPEWVESLSRVKWYLDYRNDVVSPYIDEDGWSQKLYNKSVILGDLKYNPNFIHHINGDTLDCRRENLTTKVPRLWGAAYLPNSRKWKAQFRYKGKTHYGGLFPTAQEAHNASVELRASMG